MVRGFRLARRFSLITVFSKANCFPCKLTKETMDRLGVKYEELRVDENPEALARIKELGYLQVPVVLTPEGDHWSGLQPDKIKALA